MDGQHRYDECDMTTVAEMRSTLVGLVEAEVAVLGDASRIILVGSSQGGCMALDVVMASPHNLGGCILLRSLPMDWTPADQASTNPSTPVRCPSHVPFDRLLIAPLGGCSAGQEKGADPRHLGGVGRGLSSELGSRVSGSLSGLCLPSRVGSWTEPHGGKHRGGVHRHRAPAPSPGPPSGHNDGARPRRENGWGGRRAAAG